LIFFTPRNCLPELRLHSNVEHEASKDSHSRIDRGPRIRDSVGVSAQVAIEYLVSWNFKHIVNPKTRAAIARVCEEAGFSPPMICTPDELLES
jgi:hypothetical protein